MLFASIVGTPRREQEKLFALLPLRYNAVLLIRTRMNNAWTHRCVNNA